MVLVSSNMKDITLQVFVGVLMAAIVLGFLVVVFDAQKHGVNYDLVLDKREWSCVESKTERYTTTVIVGKALLPQTKQREVCITMKRN